MGDAAGKRVVVTDHTFKSVTAEAKVARDHGASFACFSCSGEAETAEAVNGATVAFVNFAPMTRSVLARMRPGSTVIRYGIGYDNVDVASATELGIRVANVPDYGVDTVADHAVAGLLALVRRLPDYDRRIRGEGWVRPAEVGPVRGLRSTVVGLVGLGRIAQAVHARLVPFGCTFVGHDPHAPQEDFDRLGVERVALPQLARRAHAVSLHAPSTPETRRMVDAGFLAALPTGAVLVNTSRGSLVDEAALAEAVARGHLAGAALDVFESEPLAADSPLRVQPAILLSPHAAFYDEDSLARLQQLASEEAGRALRGEELRCSVA
ncbi:C-terminal binding protein [Blastococcus sp. PRF04-17]|uniref:C-terminal binding protein n=1 Tax=Blastococcus sp. PRF04-17 TaxID=2933797 RepID=UPI001FF1F4A9|nr:C-terminal binding protein [Blastococcus sp. PRF04-17]UOY03352.1 C-terminal binding protein [Blastococcus sp. PRF04-17]